MTMKTTLFVGLGTTVLLILLAVTAYFATRHVSSSKGTAAAVSLRAVDSETPFMRALLSRNDAEVQRLLEQGDVGDVNAINSEGESILMCAIRCATSERIQQLLAYANQASQTIDVNYVNTQDGQSTLMKAWSHPERVLMQQLFAYSIQTGQPMNVNFVNELDGQSTLIWAIQYATRDHLPQLWDYAIETNQPMNVNFVNEQNGQSTLMYALLYDYRHSMELLQQLFSYAIETNQPIDVNYVNQKDGQSTLLFAHAHASVEQVRQLFPYSIQTGQPMNVNYVNEQNGVSIFMRAITKGGFRTMQPLLDYSIQTNQPIDVNYVNTRTGQSTFEYALRFGHAFASGFLLMTIRLIIHHPSFEVNRSLNERGETALMLAISVRGGNVDVVREMLALPGMDRNQRNNDGKTAEQYAMDSSNDEIKRLFGVDELGVGSLPVVG